MNCWSEDIDLRCGRYRYQRHLLGIQLVNRVLETHVSRLFREHVGEPGAPVWRRANTFSPWVRNSPHHAHHSGLHDLRQVEQAFELAEFTAAAKREVLTTFFDLMREDDDDFRSSDYASGVLDLAWDAGQDQGALVTVDRLATRNASARLW